MKKNHVVLLIFSLIILVAVLTNPNQDRHKEVLKNKLNAYLQKSMKKSHTKSKNKWEQAGQALGIMLGGALIDQITDNLVSTDNYVLFSTTKITWEGQAKVIGIGAFGNVFISEKVDKLLNEQLKNNIH
ncbi:hypothetical protein C3K47_11745 [Solitalea longa]|uniref:DUF4359 domain-containing protein n=1 Tax=Solitalea longa TaxID=2079460 RepID=A0A2S5A2S8_9SPHI|nr:DUF4359 domain-containing protein [Solitalea longa]POY36413.1 hypothetical protein C3K47_11745 [Solitalea longa]